MFSSTLTTLNALPLLVLLSIFTLPLLVQPVASASVSASAPSNSQQKRSPSSSSVANEPRLSFTVHEGPPPQSSDGVLVSAATLAAELVRAIAARGSGGSVSGQVHGSSSSSVGWPAANSCAAANVRWSAADERAREWRVLDRAALEQRGALALANWPSVYELDRELVCFSHTIPLFVYWYSYTHSALNLLYIFWNLTSVQRERRSQVLWGRCFTRKPFRVIW